MGQSGNLFSPFFENLLEKWVDGEYVEIKSSSSEELLPYNNFILKKE
jgi:acyl-homoserine lactone acylase PvdQ